MNKRERDAIELLDRIYGRKAGHQLSDADMVEEWMDEEIMAFIRKYGPFDSLLAWGRVSDDHIQVGDPESAERRCLPPEVERLIKAGDRLSAFTQVRQYESAGARKEWWKARKALLGGHG